MLCGGIWRCSFRKKETKLLEKILKILSPFCLKRQKALSKEGAYIKANDGDFETPLVEDKECAYSILSPDGSLKCGIETAYDNGKINWKNLFLVICIL